MKLIKRIPDHSGVTGFFRLYLIEAADVAERLRAVGHYDLADEVEAVADEAAACPKGRASVPIIGNGRTHDALRAALTAARRERGPLIVAPRPALR